jgi:hypothetical protein
MRILGVTHDTGARAQPGTARAKLKCYSLGLPGGHPEPEIVPPRRTLATPARGGSCGGRGEPGRGGGDTMPEAPAGL